MDQLEFSISNETELELRLKEMEKHLEEMHQTVDKVRKRLFSEIGNLKYLLEEMRLENFSLKETIRRMTDEKTPWVYKQKDNLFDLGDCQEKCD